jgi:small GTP-binding protein
MELAHAIIYLDLNQDKPKINFWYPHDLPEGIRRFIGDECFSIISGDSTFIPEVLLIFPIASLKLKVLIKYFKREDNTKIGGFSKSAITFLFDEKDDHIYYRYMSYIDSYVSKAVSAIIDLENNVFKEDLIYDEVVKLQHTLCELTDYLRSKSEYVSKPEETSETTLGVKKLEEKQLEKKKFKVVVLGDPSVGKTSTILRFTDNVFLRAYIPTMGLNITQKVFDIDKNAVELVLWDIGGQTKFEVIRKKFYEGMSMILLLFDLTNPMSFANVPKWHQDIKNYFNDQKIEGYLIGNKNDLVKERIVSEKDAVRLAVALDLDYIEVSALTGYNIEKIFHKIARNLL